jgi:hypothetical protein
MLWAHCVSLVTTRLDLKDATMLVDTTVDGGR